MRTPTAWRIGAVGAALAIGFAGCTSGPGGFAPHPSSLPTSGAPVSTTRSSARTSTSSGSPQTPGSRAASAWVSRATIPLGSVTDLVGGTDAVYALARSFAADNVVPISSSVIRLARGAKTPTYSRPLQGAAGLAPESSSLWVVLTDPSAREATTIDQFDATSLRLLHTFGLHVRAASSYPAVLAAVPRGPLWVGIGKGLYRVSPTTGAVTATIAQPGALTDLSVSPDGTVLYTASSEGNGVGLIVTERSSTNGAVLSTTSIPGAVAGGQLSASSSGVWASFRTGMLGDTILLRSSDLRRLVPAPGMTGTLATPFVAVMGVDGTVSGSALWLSSYQSLACADPSTGQVRASEPLPGREAGRVVAYPDAVYVPTPGGLTVAQPPGACRVTGPA